MKKNKKVFLVAVFLVLLLVLVSCGAQPENSNGEQPDPSSTDGHPVGSMLAVHDEGVIDPDKEYTKKDCLNCHPRDAIDAATVDYHGEAGVNPHAAHTEAYDCITCHSIEGVSSLKCNACHDWELPEGWESPPKESGVQ